MFIRGFFGDPERALFFKIHSVPLDHAHLRDNKEKASAAIFPQQKKNMAGPFEAGVSEPTGKYSKKINMVD